LHSAAAWGRSQGPPLRLQFPGAVDHVTTRGNARQAIFIDDQDRRPFIRPAHQVNLLRRVCHLPLAQRACLAGVSASRVSRIQAQVEREPPSNALQRLLSGYGIAGERR
jgi:hypothetical protein